MVSVYNEHNFYDEVICVHITRHLISCPEFDITRGTGKLRTASRSFITLSN